MSCKTIAPTYIHVLNEFRLRHHGVVATWSTPAGDVVPGVPAAPLRGLLLAGYTTQHCNGVTLVVSCNSWSSGCLQHEQAQLSRLNALPATLQVSWCRLTIAADICT